jgi:hypothetical protein
VTRPAQAASLFGLALALAGPAAAQSALAGYDLAGEPAWRAELPKALAEISGLASAGDGSVYAHGDEQAAVFRFDLATRRPTERFGLGTRAGLLRGDFEDIQVIGRRVYLLTSEGVIYEAPLAGDGRVVEAVRRTAGFGGNCEAEGMAWDPDTKALLLLCKQVKSKRWKKQVVVLAVSAESWQVAPEPRMLIPESRLEEVTGARGFSGSAIARHPRTGTFILLAGPQRTYAEVDARGRVLGGGKLDKRRHPQPEGIAVTPELTLLISDESGSGPATIAAYARRP